MNLRPHQRKAVDQLSSGKILLGEVGSGKSYVALAYYTEKDECGDLYIITTAKKRDSAEWELDAAAFGIGKEESLHGKLHVDSWNNIGKYEGVEGCTFVFDEQRLVGSGAWVKSFYKIAKKNSWILLSGTPGDSWMDYIPVFVANGFFKDKTDFIRKHVIYDPYSRFPKVTGYLNESLLRRLRREVTVEMQYKKHTTRTMHYVPVEYDQAKLRTVTVDRWNPYTDEPILHAAELFATMRRVVNEDPSRLSAIRALMEEHPRLIVFYNFNYELHALRTLTQMSDLSGKGDGMITHTNDSTGSSSVHESHDIWRSRNTTASFVDSKPTTPIAEWNGQRKQPIPDTERWVYLVQYTAGCEGWNCTSTDSMAFYSLNYSWRKFEQAQGRIDRMTTLYKYLTYYALVSDSVVDRAVLEALEAKKTFNERRWLRENLGYDDPLLAA